MRRLIGVLLALCLAAGPGWAQDVFFPALYRVVGVAADDVLNVRAGPGPGFEVVATLAPGASGIEAADADPGTGWLLINVDDLAGWASPRFLERLPGPDRRAFPTPLWCGGAEPFWGLEIRADGSGVYSDPETPDRALSLGWHGPAAARMGDEFGAILTGPDREVHAVLQRGWCTDGMSEYAFGLKIDAIVRTGGQSFMLTGCCAISR